MRVNPWIPITIASWGCWSVTEKLAVKNMSPVLVILCGAYVSSALAPLVYLAMKANRIPFDWNAPGIAWTVASTLLSTVAGFTFLFALRNSPTNDVVAWTSTYPALTFCLCWLFMGEQFTLLKAMGAVMLVAGAILMNR